MELHGQCTLKMGAMGKYMQHLCVDKLDIYSVSIQWNLSLSLSPPLLSLIKTPFCALLYEAGTMHGILMSLNWRCSHFRDMEMFYCYSSYCHIPPPPIHVFKSEVCTI